MPGPKEVNRYFKSEDKKESENISFRLPIESWPFSVRTETHIGRFLRSYWMVRGSSNRGCIWSRRSLQDTFFFHFFGCSTFRSAAESIIFLERKLFPKGSAWDEDPVSFEGYQTTLESPLAYAAAEALRKFWWFKILDLCEYWAEISRVISWPVRYSLKE